MATIELLSLAAKAIGGTLSEGTGKRRTGPTWDTWEWYGGIGINLNGKILYPLEDDGDAFGIAVSLELTIHQWSDEVCVCDFHGIVNEAVAKGTDPCAAARLAIVRAAAEIGKAM